MVEPVDLVEDRLFDGIEQLLQSPLPFDLNPTAAWATGHQPKPVGLDDPDDYTADPGPTLTMSGPKDGAGHLGDRLRQMGGRLAIQVIGEAARNVTTEARALAPEIPWGRVVGMRHHLVHRYWDVNLEVVWDVAQRDLPALTAVLEPLLDRSEDA